MNSFFWLYACFSSFSNSLSRFLGLVDRAVFLTAKLRERLVCGGVWEISSLRDHSCRSEFEFCLFYFLVTRRDFPRGDIPKLTL